MNSENILFNNIIKFSLFNMSTIIGENIKYFMYTYNMAMSDWYNSFSYIDKKIYVYVNRKVDMDVKYTAHAIQDLCEMRDLHNFELFDNAEIEHAPKLFMMAQLDGYGGVHGGMGFGTRNAEGDRILEFGDAVGMVVCNTFFKKKYSKLITYQSGDNRSMIYYLDGQENRSLSSEGCEGYFK